MQLKKKNFLKNLHHTEFFKNQFTKGIKQFILIKITRTQLNASITPPPPLILLPPNTILRMARMAIACNHSLEKLAHFFDTRFAEHKIALICLEIDTYIPSRD